MSDKNDIKRLDVKLHNYILSQNEAHVALNEANNALVNWVIYIEKLVVVPKLREQDTVVCMSAIL